MSHSTNVVQLWVSSLRKLLAVFFFVHELRQATANPLARPANQLLACIWSTSHDRSVFWASVQSAFLHAVRFCATNGTLCICWADSRRADRSEAVAAGPSTSGATLAHSQQHIWLANIAITLTAASAPAAASSGRQQMSVTRWSNWCHLLSDPNAAKWPALSCGWRGWLSSCDAFIWADSDWGADDGSGSLCEGGWESLYRGGDRRRAKGNQDALRDEWFVCRPGDCHNRPAVVQQWEVSERTEIVL